MMDFDGFNELVDAIVRQGYSEEQAAEFAELIGDTPLVGDGIVVVRKDGVTIAELPIAVLE